MKARFANMASEMRAFQRERRYGATVRESRVSSGVAATGPIAHARHRPVYRESPASDLLTNQRPTRFDAMLYRVSDNLSVRVQLEAGDPFDLARKVARLFPSMELAGWHTAIVGGAMPGDPVHPRAEDTNV